MTREFFKKHFRKWRSRPGEVPPEHGDALARRLATYQLPGPPGVADHALWTLMSRKDVPSGRRRRRG